MFLHILKDISQNEKPDSLKFQAEQTVRGLSLSLYRKCLSCLGLSFGVMNGFLTQ